jgi:NAD(P)-dependent dehydrogenase (short-subunit alcohol dehydrogenase family)
MSPAGPRLARAGADVVLSVDVLGIFRAQPALEIPDDEWRHYFETNVLTAVRLTRAYLRHQCRAARRLPRQRLRRRRARA